MKYCCCICGVKKLEGVKGWESFKKEKKEGEEGEGEVWAGCPKCKEKFYKLIKEVSGDRIKF